MLSWLGTFALALTFCSTLLAMGLWARSATRGVAGPPRWVGLLPLAGALGTVAVLESALLRHDFSIVFVATNGSRETSPYYTVTSLWAAHDGSLLLWVLIITGYLAVVALRRAGSPALHGWATTVMSATAAFFAGLALFTTDVFDTVSPVPADGPGPNPLLADHPAMGIHPPLLYLGLLGMAVPFAYAVAGLITGQVGQGWVRTIRGFTLSAWILLTAGIVLGAWWSYAVLGWGGYWSWDPVENASLLPWLLATALVHSCMVQRNHRSLPVWNLALAVGAFVLACLASFLTRSGVVTSVHAFAESSLGPVLLGFLAALVACVAALVLLRPERLRSPRESGPLLSRATAILLNNVLLTTVATVVLVGTLSPIVVEMVDGNRVSVGPPYFNRTALPIALLVLLGTGVGPLLGWRGARPAVLARRLVPAVLTGLAVVVVVAALAPTGALPLLTFGVAAFVLVCILFDSMARAGRGRGGVTGPLRWVHDNRRRASGLLAHLGVAMAAVGIAASSAYGAVVNQTLAPGDTVTVAGHQLRMLSLHRSSSAGTMQTSAWLALVDGDGTEKILRPGLRYFRAQDTTVAVPAISSSPGGDVYTTLLAANNGRTASLRLAVNPLVGWIWAGGALMALGGVGSLWPRRHGVRRAAPSQALAPAPALVQRQP